MSGHAASIVPETPSPTNMRQQQVTFDMDENLVIAENLRLQDEYEFHTPASHAAPGTPFQVVIENDEALDENPQEASSPPSSDAETLAQEKEQTTKSSRRRWPMQGWKRHKRGRRVRVVAVAEEPETVEDLPATQYETVLRRRAIRKEEPENSVPPSPSSSSPRRSLFRSLRGTDRDSVAKKDVLEGYDEEVGDTSLGMKLTIMGGRVVVQAVSALADGRASPAQLTGMIRRGDVLLAIDDKSIVNLPLDHLMSGLKPLSTPDEDGAYKRALKLRFSIGEGLDLLNKKNAKGGGPETPADVFSFAQFLRQDFDLSGSPSAEQKGKRPVVATAISSSASSAENLFVEKTPLRVRTTPSPRPKSVLPLNEIISLSLADLLHDERQRFMSEFFSWNDSLSELLRPSIVVTVKATKELADFLDKKERIKEGEKSLKGAQVLTHNMEDIDKGNDLRSFQAWSSNISLRSKASTRRRQVFEASSVIGSTIKEEVSSDVVANSVGSEDVDDVDGDELLTELAAFDEIWRRQVLESIESVIKQIEEDNNEQEKDEPEPIASHDITDTLGNLFMGEHVHKLITKKKKSFALPPPEVTSVLFDLVTHLAATTPDEISVKGKFEINPQTSLVPFQRSRNATVNQDAVLATLFVVNDVFPKWLKAFKPIPWEERRVMWPYTKASQTESTAGGSLGDDLLSLDSASLAGSPMLQKKRKNLRETIEDMELDVELRAESCFLVTFYFTQEILPGIMTQGSGLVGWRNMRSFSEEDAIEFVDKYGAYLKLPMSVAYAAFTKSEPVFERLLELAKHDPRHKEALGEIARIHSIVLYEPTMLSAIAYCVRTLKKQKVEGRSHLIHLCVSAYPDLRPWLVRKGCLGDCKASEGYDEDLKDLYYAYLSLLLHPFDGHDLARQEDELVKEWCEMSVHHDVGSKDAYRRSRRANFVAVASRSEVSSRRYRRDLLFLFNLAVQAKEVDLSLELIDEMLDYKGYVSSDESMSAILSHIREVANASLPTQSMLGSRSMHEGRLKKSFSLFEKFSSAQRSLHVRDLGVSAEYNKLIDACASNRRADFLKLLVSQADPMYCLKSLNSWCRRHPKEVDYLEIVQRCLKRAAMLRNREEFSSALLRISKARTENGLHAETHVREDYGDHEQETAQGNIWRRMLTGNIQIDK